MIDWKFSSVTLSVKPSQKGTAKYFRFGIIEKNSNRACSLKSVDEISNSESWVVDQSTASIGSSWIPTKE